MTYILDASAMIAVLRAETGGEVVDAVIRSGQHVCFAHAMNLCEVYYEFHRGSGKEVADDVIETLR